MPLSETEMEARVELSGTMQPLGKKKISGGDAPGGNTRTHTEHEGKGPGGGRYYAGDGMEEQVAAGLKVNKFN